MGYTFDPASFEAVHNAFLTLADAKGRVEEADLHAIAQVGSSSGSNSGSSPGSSAAAAGGSSN